jgi:serine/threonine protein kinase
MNFSLKEVLNGRIKHDNLVYYENAETDEEIVNNEKKYCLNIHMDYFDSGDLKSFLKNKNLENSFLSEIEALDFMKQISSGLKGLHDYSIVHRGIFII